MQFFICRLLHLITNRMRLLIPLVFLKPYIYMYGFKNTKGIKICSHNVNRMESKFDETKNYLLQSKYPSDIIGFCDFFT